MRSDYVLSKKANPSPGGVPPSLVDLCVLKAIDNIRYIGNVGELDSHLLERILPHCRVEQLMHIENCTEGRDLSCVTNNLWKTFYAKEFGIEHTEVVIERMRKQNCSFSWRLLYQAKLKYRDDVKNKSVERLTELYKEADASKLTVVLIFPHGVFSFFPLIFPFASFVEIDVRNLDASKKLFFHLDCQRHKLYRSLKGIKPTEAPRACLELKRQL